MRINQKLVDDTESMEYLIVDMCHELDLIAVTQLNVERPKRPQTLVLTDTLSQIGLGKLKVLEHSFSPFLFMSDEELLTDNKRSKWLQRRDNSYNIIAPLIDNDELRYNYLFVDSNSILHSLIEASGRSRSYVAKILNRYWYYGSHINALLPLWRNCGTNQSLPDSPESVQDPEFGKNGPRTKYGNPYRGATKKDIANIKLFSKGIPNGSKARLSDLYGLFTRQFMYAQVKPKLEDAQELSLPVPRAKLISPTSFRYHFMKNVDQLELIRKSVGTINYQKDHRGRSGLARQGVRGPTSRYEIDATVVDLYIRYPYDKTNQLATGRPVIYLVVDTWSGMIVGTHACFHGPDWTGASQALFNAFTDKVEFARRYGVEITENEWPCHHVCSQLVMDRGSEYTDRNIESMLKGLIGLSVASFAPYHRGDCKGTVEKAFDIFHKNAVQFVPGQVMKIPNKEEQHASRKASISFELFMERLIKAILYTNNNRMRINNHTFEMSRDDVGFSPRDLYVYGLEEMILPPAQIPEAQLRFALLPADKATVRMEGIHFRGLYYSSNKIIQQKWLDNARNFGRYTVEIRYDQNLTNWIWCKDPETNELITLELTDRSEKYRNQIWQSTLHEIELTKEKQSHHQERAFSNKIEFLNKMDEIDQKAKADARFLKTSSAKSIEKGIKERKSIVSSIERSKQSERIAATLNSKESTKSTSTLKPQDLESPDFFDFDDDHYES
ncbi:Integrase [Vibrio chagasii]|nr:Integrase [Vibrio chagasii]CAH7023796.1 Integrase [Vibrio chagasii]CAH7030646.1 Integrase [Vibrio chagasii]CAH7088411.1 Integrase [Vibrio chagasii]CAH7273692.1 Integrase [Vibrio chagasii]